MCIKGILLSFLLTKAVTTVITRRMNSYHNGHIVVSYGNICGYHEKNVWPSYRIPYAEYSGYRTGYIMVIMQDHVGYHAGMHGGYHTRDILIILRWVWWSSNR